MPLKPPLTPSPSSLSKRPQKPFRSQIVPEPEDGTIRKEARRQASRGQKVPSHLKKYPERTLRLRQDQINALHKIQTDYNARRKHPTAKLTMDELGRILVTYFLKARSPEDLIDDLRSDAS